MNIETVFCPFCGKALEYPSQLRGSLIQCKYCSSYFKWEVATEPLKQPSIPPKEAPKATSTACNEQKHWNSTAATEKQRNQTSGGGIRSAIVIAAAIVFVGIVYCVTNYMGSRYYTEKIDKTTYRIDRHTGEMSIIKPNGVITKAKEPRIIKDRELSFTEMNNLTGRGGPENYDTRFSGTIYNGNDAVIVTEIDIRVTFTNEEKKVSRVYKDANKVFPLSTSTLYFSILSPGRGFVFDGWSIDGARGYDKLSDDD